MKNAKNFFILISLLSLILVIAFINNSTVYSQSTTTPQWRGTSNIKAPILAENLEYLYNQTNSSSRTTKTLLWQGWAQINSSNTAVNIPLNDSWRNYDALIIVSNHNGYVDLFTYNYVLTDFLDTNYYILQSGVYPNMEPFLIKVVNDTTLQNITFSYNGYSNHTVRAVYGLKY